MAIRRRINFEGWPGTKVIPEKKEIRLTARYLSPGGYWWCWRVWCIGIIVIVVGCLWMYPGVWTYRGTRPDYSGVIWLLTNRILLGIGILFAVYKLILPFLFKYKVSFVFNDKYIKIKNGYVLGEWMWGPIMGWGKYNRHANYEINIESAGVNQFSFSFVHPENYIRFPSIYGQEDANKLAIRLNQIQNGMNVWVPEAWDNEPWVEHWDFVDLDRKVWPMTEKEKGTWRVGEVFYGLLSFLAASMALNALMFVGMRVNNHMGFFWYLYKPEGIIGNYASFWWPFYGVFLFVVLIFLGLAFFYLFRLMRFWGRSGRVDGYPYRWEMEKGGMLRFNLGLINWSLAYLVAFPLFFKYAIPKLNDVFTHCHDHTFWPCLKPFLIGQEAILTGVLLGGLTSLLFLYFADLIKLILDMPFKLKFPNREMGMRDLIFYFFEK